MKLRRITRLFGIIVILSMLMVALPAAPAMASYDIEIDPEEGAIGTEITITGEDFGWSDTTERWVTVYFSEDEADESDQIDDEVENYEKVVAWEDVEEDDDGSFEATFEVPDELTDGDDDVDVESGTYYIYVVCTTDTESTTSVYIRAVAEFEVVAGEIELDEDEGPVGTLVEITGTGFGAEDDIEIEYHDGSTTVDLSIYDGDDETDDDGEFETVVRIPESTTGDHVLTVTVGSSEAEAEFTVEPEILLDTQSGEPGTEVTVSGTGFGKRDEIEVYFNDQGVATERTSSTGSFTVTFLAPEGLEAGIYNVDAEDGTSVARAKFTLNAAPSSTPTPEPAPETEEPTTTPSNISLTANPTTGKVNDLVTLIGTGFNPTSQIVVKYAGEEAATVTSNDQGVFSAAIYVPGGGSGAQTITVTDGVNTTTTTFTVESVPPEVPPPLEPAMGAKMKSPATFKWEEVTDDSLPVTYTLQIATSEDYATDSIVFEKENITGSEYMLTEEELALLQEAEHDGAYYWRIRAIDAASNAGQWTGNGEFYLTSPFDFPDWATYTLLAIGAVIIFGVGYWLGRRTAFYY